MMSPERRDPTMPGRREQDVIEWRVTQLEQAVTTMARAANQQQDFNVRVERFMVAARVWGMVALLLYGLGQAALVTVLNRAIGA